MKEKSKQSQPTLDDLTGFYLKLLEEGGAALSVEKIKELLNKGDKIIRDGLKSGKSFDEISDWLEANFLVLEKLQAHPELGEDADAAFTLIVQSIQKRLDAPWGRPLL